MGGIDPIYLVVVPAIPAIAFRPSRLHRVRAELDRGRAAWWSAVREAEGLSADSPEEVQR